MNNQQLAFPTAKGAGAYATGGRGGQVIHVTTLDWDASGGLKEALQTQGARIIVFDVSGEIDATQEGYYSEVIHGDIYDDLTIAGQTAPEGGITIRTNEFMFFDVSNVIIRYIRFRGTSNQDTFWMQGGKNIILDHCTFSHGGDESGSLGSGFNRPSDATVAMGNITVQRCFFQDSKTGTILGTEDAVNGGGIDGDFTVLNNVYSNISHRFPNPKGSGQYDIINNVVYNWKYRLIRITSAGTYNVINNYYKPSNNGLRLPAWFGTGSTKIYQQKISAHNETEIPLVYTSGNIVTGERETPQTDDRDMWTGFYGSTEVAEYEQIPNRYFVTSMYPLVGQSFDIKSANQTYIDLLEDVGANKTLNSDGSIYPYLDSKDTSDILMIKDDTYSGNFYSEISTIPYPVVPENTRPANFYISNPHIPEDYFIRRGVMSDSNSHNLVMASGCTLMEEYLNEIDGESVITNVENVILSPSLLNTIIGDTTEISVDVLPHNASNKTGIWSTSNNSVISITQDGMVTGISEGTATITFTSNDGMITDTTEVTVTETEESNDNDKLSKKYKIIIISK